MYHMHIWPRLEHISVYLITIVTCDFISIFLLIGWAKYGLNTIDQIIYYCLLGFVQTPSILYKHTPGPLRLNFEPLIH